MSIETRELSEQLESGSFEDASERLRSAERSRRVKITAFLAAMTTLPAMLIYALIDAGGFYIGSNLSSITIRDNWLGAVSMLGVVLSASWALVATQYWRDRR